MDHTSGNVAVQHQISPSATNSIKAKLKYEPQYHVVYDETLTLSNQAEIPEIWKRLITSPQTRHKVPSNEKANPKLHDEKLSPTELDSIEQPRRKWDIIERSRPPAVHQSQQSRFKEMPAHSIPDTSGHCSGSTRGAKHDDSLSALDKDTSAANSTEDWEEDPGVPTEPPVESSVGWQTRKRWPIDQNTSNHRPVDVPKRWYGRLMKDLEQHGYSGNLQRKTLRNPDSRHRPGEDVNNMPNFLHNVTALSMAISSSEINNEDSLKTHAPVRKLDDQLNYEHHRERDDCNFKVCQVDPYLVISRRVICIHYVYDCLWFAKDN